MDPETLFEWANILFRASTEADPGNPGLTSLLGVRKAAADCLILLARMEREHTAFILLSSKKGDRRNG